MEPQAPDSQEPGHTFTPSDRIRQLNDIDKDIATLLHSAGLAIQSLTNASTTEEPSTTNTLQSHQAAFKSATSQYFALLSSIDVRLRRQVHALEEAGIIQPESASKAAENAPASSKVNPLDISWLNSRKDTVGRDKEAEVWAEARELVTRLRAAEAGKEDDVMEKVKDGASEEKMEVD
ncbi:hypothetical protein AJ80_02696 [Polytolypa hystricis UAMH7299]|uniref:Mediator of RNA polymerase II transcription subunit 11 n=1 Tax=Polytolypa hystricis (strain UAMH7299) TaxID=1447883 RepID=A0A2B7YQ26_POLH7|nr:hypothetical protein AJ80_02696 [Polytolypa hystricis UAMH7299]